MTDADRAALKALVEQWRDDSGSWEPGIGSGIEMCADELDALIAAGLSEAPRVNPRIMKLISRASQASGYLCEHEDDVIGKQIGEDLWNAVEAVTSSDASVAGYPQEATGLSEAPAPQEKQHYQVGGYSEVFLGYRCSCGGIWHVYQGRDPVHSKPALASPAPPKEPTHD